MEAALTTDRYEEQRAAVHAHLRARFGQLFDEGDRDDLLHDAFLAVVDKHERGEVIENETALLKTIAFRRGRDRLRGRHSDPCDPIAGALALVVDDGPDADERVQVQLEAELCREVIAALKDRQRKMLRLRLDWGLPAAEVQRALGMTQRTYERQMTRALKRVAEIVGEIQDGTWSQKQLDLLMAVEAGTATADEIATAQRLVENDPHCRALLRRLRGAAAVMPLPFLLPAATESSTRSAASSRPASSSARDRRAPAGRHRHRRRRSPPSGGAKGAGGLGGLATIKVVSLVTAGTVAVGGTPSGRASSTCPAAASLPGDRDGREPEAARAEVSGVRAEQQRRRRAPRPPRS